MSCEKSGLSRCLHRATVSLWRVLTGWVRDFARRVRVLRCPYFIKLSGPEKTVTKWHHAFEQFVNSFKAR
jgi:hypothetical protein